MISHTLDEAKKTNLPVYKFFSDKQTGTSFGQKLANSLENIYSYGYDNVIVIGTDCPSINSSVLLNAQQELSNKNLVLGPSKDGGVYLIGIHKNAYSRDAFLDIPWLSRSVFEAFKIYAAQQEIAISIAPIKQDADDYITLLEWRSEHSTHLISTFILQIILLFNKVIDRISAPFISIQLHFSKTLFRGPPRFFFQS